MKQEWLVVFEKLIKLLENFDIGTKDWILCGPRALDVHGIPYDYKRNNHFHIAMDLDRVPWKLSDNEKDNHELVPIPNSEFGKAYTKFVESEGCDFDIIVSPKPISSYNDLHFLSIGDISIKVAKLKDDIDFGHHTFSQFPDEKMTRIIEYYEPILEYIKSNKLDSEEKKLLEHLKIYKERERKNTAQTNNSLSTFEKSSLIKGTTAYKGKVEGEVIALDSVNKKPGNLTGKIVVARNTSPNIASQVVKAKAIVVDEGGILSHATILSREFKIPCVVGTKIATKVLKTGDKVEVDADNGIVKKL